VSSLEYLLIFPNKSHPGDKI